MMADLLDELSHVSIEQARSCLNFSAEKLKHYNQVAILNGKFLQQNYKTFEIFWTKKGSIKRLKLGCNSDWTGNWSGDTFYPLCTTACVLRQL